MKSRGLTALVAVSILGMLGHGAVAQDFTSPIAPGGTVNNTETIFSSEWCYESDLLFRRSSPTLADVNGDSTLEVIAGSLDGRLHVLNPVTGQPLPGWPQLLSAPIDSTASVGDVDGDGDPEIVVGCGVSDTGSFQAGGWTNQSNGALYVFNPDGSLVLRQATLDWWNMANGATTPDGFTEGVITNPSLGDFDEDGDLEIIYGAFDMLVYGINGGQGAREASHGNPAGQFNMGAPLPFTNSMYRFDQDGDGRWDEDPPHDTTPFPIGDGIPGFAGIDDDGDGVVDDLGIDTTGDGWPEHSVAHWADDDEDSDQPDSPLPNMDRVDEDPFEWPFHVSDTVWASAAICDIDGDGHLDVLQPADGYYGSRVFGLNRLAECLPGWCDVTVESNVWTEVAAGDVDGDGFYEFFMGTNTWYHPSLDSWRGGMVMGLNHDGTEIIDGDLNGDTFGVFGITDLGPVNPQAHEKPFVLSHPALGDIDGDGELEVVVGSANITSGSIHAWNSDGSPVPGFPVYSPFAGWEVYGPQDFGNVVGGPALADIDGDGDIEIMFLTSHAFFVALHHDGTFVQGSPFWGMDCHDGRGVLAFGDFQSTPAVGDIDGDGRVEIVITGRDHAVTETGRGRIWCFEAGAFNPTGLEWPMQGSDARNTGVYSEKVVSVPLPGDANLDGCVDVADLVRLRLALNGQAAIPPGTQAFSNSTIVSGSEITEADFQALLQILLTQDLQ